jgi:hypothetical protein
MLLQEVWKNNLFDKNFLWHLFYHLWWITAKGTIAAHNKTGDQSLKVLSYPKAFRMHMKQLPPSLPLDEVSNSGFTPICNFKSVTVILLSSTQ